MPTYSPRHPRAQALSLASEPEPPLANQWMKYKQTPSSSRNHFAEQHSEILFPFER
jgi:hypothetical protein